MLSSRLWLGPAWFWLSVETQSLRPQDERETIELDLVLQIYADLLLVQRHIAEWSGRFGSVRCIDRIDHIDGRSEIELLQIVDIVVFQIDAKQHFMLQWAGIDAVFELIVHRRLIGNVLGEEVESRQIGGRWRCRIAKSVIGCELHIDMGIARVLPEGHALREILFELIADRRLVAIPGVHVRLAGEDIGADPAERCVHHRADIG